eukprot:TRINITY_DN570_c0_g1_i1.p1 TRINITY_DN570_c0_g1~~TRINITY_DN570_c0_g1_i1.p1  ORF type:complete len:132 (+),score=4.88 TRINITY_DN570_c0_g1_i1:54-449(+)
MTCKFEAIQKIPFAAFKLNEQVRQPMDYHYREVAENWAVQKRQKRFGPPFNLDTMLQTLISKLSLHKSLIDEFESYKIQNFRKVQKLNFTPILLELKFSSCWQRLINYISAAHCRRQACFQLPKMPFYLHI